MSVEMKLGRWMDRKEREHRIDINKPRERFCWASSDEGRVWAEGGRYWTQSEDALDLIRYLGPLELSPAPVCAEQAGTPVVSTVSTETAGEQLKRMKQREAAIWRELEIYLPIVDALKAAASDLDEAIKRLENGVEEQASEDHEAAACAVIQDERRDG